jgi:hypothetical protein
MSTASGVITVIRRPFSTQAKRGLLCRPLLACVLYGRTYLFEPLLSLTELKKIVITANRFTFVINDESGVS